MFNWSKDKNELLKAERGVSFENIQTCIESGDLLDITAHPNKTRYPNQKIFIVKLKDYVYMVPFVEEGDELFLKTIIPSRKYTKKYLGGVSK